MTDKYRDALRSHLTPNGHTLGCPAPMGLDCTGPCRLTRDALAEGEEPAEPDDPSLDGRLGEWLGVGRRA